MKFAEGPQSVAVHGEKNALVHSRRLSSQEVLQPGPLRTSFIKKGHWMNYKYQTSSSSTVHLSQKGTATCLFHMSVAFAHLNLCHGSHRSHQSLQPKGWGLRNHHFWEQPIAGYSPFHRKPPPTRRVARQPCPASSCCPRPEIPGNGEGKW